MGTWLVILGLITELAGIGLAVSGVVGVGDELFPGLRFPHRPAVRWVKQRIFRRRPPDQSVTLGSAVMVLEAGDVRARGTRGRPAEDAPLAEWNLYWESRLGNLQEGLDWLAEDMRKADAKNAERIAEVTQRIETEIPRLQGRLRDVVGGKGGRGLLRTWWGLVAIGGGAVLQVVGGLIG